MKEIWRPVVGYKGLYEVSDLGRIRSVSRLVRGPRVLRVAYGRMMSLHREKGDYFKVNLWKDGFGHKFYVHRLVAATFCRGTGHDVNHLDLNKGNNLATNLEWCSRQDNMKHYFRRIRGNN